MCAPSSFPPTSALGDQSSMNWDVVDEDVDDDVLAGVDLATHPLAATYDVLRVQGLSRLAAQTYRLCSFLRDELLPLPDAEEVLLDLPDHLQGLRRTVQSPPHPLEDVHVNCPLVCKIFFRNAEDFVSENSLNKWVSIGTSTSSSTSPMLNALFDWRNWHFGLLTFFHFSFPSDVSISSSLVTILPSATRGKRQTSSVPFRSHGATFPCHFS